MQRRLFMEAHRQIPIAAHFACKVSKWPGQFIGFMPIVFVFRFDEEHVLPVVRPMARSFPTAPC